MTDNPAICICIIKIEIRITFKIETGYYLKLLTPVELLGRNKNKITKDEYVKMWLILEIPKVVLVHCNIVNKDYKQDSGVLFTFIPNKPIGQN